MAGRGGQLLLGQLFRCKPPTSFSRLDAAKGYQLLPQLAASIHQLSNAQFSSAGSGSASAARFDPLLWIAGTLGLAVGVAAGPCLADDGKNDAPSSSGKGFQMLSLSSKRRIFFKYEKRIRDNSTLEKVFDYFSSTVKDGVKYMTPKDLLAAIVPTYPASDSDVERAGYLDGEARPKSLSTNATAQTMGEKVFATFDVNGDGRLCFTEFLLLCTLLSIPEADVATIFSIVDLDGDGSVDATEFDALLSRLQSMANMQSRNVALAGRAKMAASKDGDVSGLLVSFFGQDLRGHLNVQQFMDFLKQLHVDLVRLEFAHYDPTGRGTLTGTDFARALVASADIKQVDALLDRVDALPPDIASAAFTLEDWDAWHSLRTHLHKLTVGLDFLAQVGRKVTREELSMLVKRLTDTTLSSRVLDMLMALFPTAPGADELDAALVLDVLRRREFLGATVRRAARVAPDSNGSGGAGMAGRMWSCLRRCGTEM